MRNFLMGLLSVMLLFTVTGCGQSEKAKQQAEEAKKAEEAKLEEAKLAATAIFDDYVKSSERLLEIVDKVVKEDRNAIQEYVTLNNKLKKAALDLTKQSELLTKEQNDKVAELAKKLAEARQKTNR